VGRVLPAAVRGGRRSWKEVLGGVAGLRVPRSTAHTGGEGRAKVTGPEVVTARTNCGGGARAATTAAAQIRAVDRRCGARVRWGFWRRLRAARERGYG
jgi:hypothetical protein